MISRKAVPLWRFLGDVSIHGADGDLTRFLGKKPIALLAYLALAREGARRDELAALLWPDPDPARSKQNLRQCLVALRKAFGNGMRGVLEIRDDWLGLNEDKVETDVWRLLELNTGAAVSGNELLDLCRGPFLRAFFTRAEPFDKWAEMQRDRLADLARRALATALAAANESASAAEAARLSAALVDLDLKSVGNLMPETQVAVAPRAPHSLKRWMRSATFAILGAVFAATSLLFVYVASDDLRSWFDRAILGESAPQSTIAVLPFTTLNGTPEEVSLAGGVTLGVTYGLYTITARELFVVTPASVAQKLKESERIARARALGVRYLISGSVAVVAGDVRVDVQCLDVDSDAGTSSLVCDDRFYQPKAEAYRLQDDITLRILKQLKIELTTAELNRIQYLDDTDNLDAWLAAASGLRHLIRVTKKDVELAKAFYEEALESDPDYVSARRGLAWVAFLSVRLGWAANPEAEILEAKNQLGIVLRKRPDDGTTKSLEGSILLLEGKYDEAIAAGELAIEKLPGSADIWAVLAHTLTYVGEHERALELINKAMRLSELHPRWYGWSKGRALRMAGQYEASIEVLEEDLGQGNPVLIQLIELTASYSAADRIFEARRIARMIRRAVPGFSASAWLEHPRINIPEIQSQEFEYLSRAGL